MILVGKVSLRRLTEMTKFSERLLEKTHLGRNHSKEEYEISINEN